jgi:hypothetical protein
MELSADGEIKKPGVDKEDLRISNAIRRTSVRTTL